MTSRIEFYHTSSTSYYNTNPWFRGFEGIPQQDMIVYGLWFKPAATASQTGVQPVIWRVSDQTTISAATNLSSLSRSYTANTWAWMPFDKPVELTAGVSYRMGIHGASVPAVSPANTAHTETSGDGKLSIKWIQEATSSSTIGTYPSTVSNDREPNIRVEGVAKPSPFVHGIYSGILNTTSSTSPNTYCSLGHFTTDVVLKSIVMTLTAPMNNNAAKAVIYNSSTSALVYSESFSGITIPESGLLELPLTTPPTLTANTQYKIGFYNTNSNTVAYKSPASAVGTAWASSDNGVSFVKDYAGFYYSTTDAVPNSPNSYELPMGFVVQRVNSIPTAPTGLTTNSPVTVGNQLTANWTHNDPDSDPQNQYQLRWRKI